MHFPAVSFLRRCVVGRGWGLRWVAVDQVVSGSFSVVSDLLTINSMFLVGGFSPLIWNNMLANWYFRQSWIISLQKPGEHIKNIWRCKPTESTVCSTSFGQGSWSPKFGISGAFKKSEAHQGGFRSPFRSSQAVPRDFSQREVPFGCWIHLHLHLGVSKNRGTPKWMVYKGKPY